MLIPESAPLKVIIIDLANELPQITLRKALNVVLFDRIVSVHYHGNEERQHNIDVEADERVQINATEPPEHHRFVRHDCECGKHVIAIDECEQAL